MAPAHLAAWAFDASTDAPAAVSRRRCSSRCCGSPCVPISATTTGMPAPTVWSIMGTSSEAGSG